MPKGAKEVGVHHVVAKFLRDTVCGTTAAISATQSAEDAVAFPHSC